MNNQVTFGQALSSAFSAIFHMFTAAEKAAITVEATIDLAHNEVRNLDELQQMRLDESRNARAVQQAELKKQLAAAKAA
jgi:hypothetical protein